MDDQATLDCRTNTLLSKLKAWTFKFPIWNIRIRTRPDKDEHAQLNHLTLTYAQAHTQAHTHTQTQTHKHTHKHTHTQTLFKGGSMQKIASQCAVVLCMRLSMTDLISYLSIKTNKSQITSSTHKDYDRTRALALFHQQSSNQDYDRTRVLAHTVSGMYYGFTFVGALSKLF